MPNFVSFVTSTADLAHEEKLCTHPLTHSITQSINQSINQLIWCPGAPKLALRKMWFLHKHPIGCEAQLAWKCLFTVFIRQALLTCKVGHTDLVLACNQGSLVGLHTQDYKLLCAVVMICSTMVNIQIDTHPHAQTAFWPAYVKSSASWAKSIPIFGILAFKCLGEAIYQGALQQYWFCFDSHTPAVALLVWHRTYNLQVVGSSHG